MDALAYLDPGSGSMIVGAVAGGMAGMAVAAKSMAHRIKSPFKKKGAPEAAPAEDEATEPADS